ncbi:hypothetical protein [Gephyromycinifex aptenodytis]|uniref:hypothetical protein n=1 Tax=Gephyromycinifex aptenodytis TaxID=2716227 RepID=UPI001447789F|nr:hypothetical protein [Gephyromycinifex aptenodytis]
MSPSSLIFVAVVAIWATYIVVDTTRRREHLATARSVDRFSAQMRVLQRRAVRRESAQTFEASSAPVRRSASALLYRTPAPAGARGSVVNPSTGSTRLAKPAPVVMPRSVRRQRRVAAVAALVAALTALVCGVLAGFGLVHVAVPVAAAVVSVCVVAWLRSQAVADRARVRRVEAAVRRAAERQLRAAQEPVQEELIELPPLVATPKRVAADEPFDVRQWDEPEVVAEPDKNDPLQGTPGWEPIPVPPPTYTLKARADHPVPPPLAVPDNTPVALQDDWDDVAWDEPWSRAVGD